MKALYALLNKKTKKNVEYSEILIDDDFDYEMMKTFGYDEGKIFIESDLSAIQSFLTCLKTNKDHCYFQKSSKSLKEDSKNGDIVIVKLTQEIIEE